MLEVTRFLVDTRGRSAAATRAREAVAATTMLQLTPHWAIDATTWVRLIRDEQLLLQAVAHGRTARQAVLVGRSAARILGLPVVDIGEPTHEPVELALPNGTGTARSRWLPGTLHRRLTIAPEDILHIAGARVASPAKIYESYLKWEHSGQLFVLLDAMKRLTPPATRDTDFERLARQRRSIVQRCAFIAGWYNAPDNVTDPLLSYARALIKRHAAFAGNRLRPGDGITIGWLLHFQLIDAPAPTSYCLPTDYGWIRHLEYPRERFRADPAAAIAELAKIQRFQRTSRADPHCEVCAAGFQRWRTIGILRMQQDEEQWINERLAQFHALYKRFS